MTSPPPPRPASPRGPVAAIPARLRRWVDEEDQLEVTAEQVKSLRERTGAGIMDCRRALVDADGDMGRAEKLLEERGIERAEKKSTRETRQGLVEAYIH